MPSGDVGQRLSGKSDGEKSFSGAVRPRAGRPGLECACELCALRLLLCGSERGQEGYTRG